MSTHRHTSIFRIILVTLFLISILSANRKSSGALRSRSKQSGQSTKQLSKPSSVSKPQLRTSTTKSRTRSTSIQRFSKPSIGLSTSRMPSPVHSQTFTRHRTTISRESTSSGATTKSFNRQRLGNPLGSSLIRTKTTNPSPTAASPPKPISRVRPNSSANSSNKRPTIIRKSSEPIKPTPNIQPPITTHAEQSNSHPSIRSRIGNFISRRKPSSIDASQTTHNNTSLIKKSDTDNTISVPEKRRSILPGIRKKVESEESQQTSSSQDKRRATVPTRGIFSRIFKGKHTETGETQRDDKPNKTETPANKLVDTEHTRDSQKDVRLRNEGDFGSSKPRDIIRRKRIALRDNPLAERGHRIERKRVHRFAKPTSVIYHDSPQLVRHVNRHMHIYKDNHYRLCHRIIWPRFRFVVRYHWGPHLVFRYVYPYYHRKYIFVSLDGYWPIEYRYLRYYWYGWHPYFWCGYYPIPHQVEGDTYNYYTYNYYYSGAGESVETCQTSQGITDDYIPPADHTTFADVREKLAKQKAEPDLQTLVDTLFEEAVKAFENGEYDSAVEKFAAGVELAPEDMVLPFAYAQALFANEQYAEATEMLRTALEKVTPQEQGVFYPRGLYPDEDVLLWQIERLASEAEQNTRNADLQLLLAYQLLGIGELDAATEPLLQASQDVENATAAEILLELIEKLKADSITETETTTEQTDYE
jgi:hypothetical protein